MQQANPISQGVMQALAQAQAGDLAAAEAALLDLARQAPGDPMILHNLGVLAVLTQRLSVALPRLRAAVEADPAQARYWVAYADALLRAAQPAAAAQLLDAAKARGLRDPLFDRLRQRLPASVRLPPPPAGEVDRLARLCDARDWPQAEALARRLAQTYPRHPLPWRALASVLKERREWLAAAEAQARAVELVPEDALGHSNLGLLLRYAGEVERAERSLLEALRLSPDLVEALNNLGLVYRDLNRPDEARAQLERAQNAQPDSAEVLTNLALLEGDRGQLAEAAALLHQALDLAPGLDLPHLVHGAIMERVGRLDEAGENYRAALQVSPQSPLRAGLLSNLAGVERNLGRAALSDQLLHEAVVADPDDLAVQSNLLFSLNYTDNATATERLALARNFGTAVSRRAQPYQHERPAHTPAALRVGFVSGDFRNHAVAKFLLNLVEALRGHRVELWAYPTLHARDAITDRLVAAIPHWRPIVGHSDAAAARLIHGDGVDVLIDLAGHTAYNRLGVFGYRPAPVQATWLGYFATTGVAQIDYFLGDAVSIPDALREQFTETVWYLPDTRLCFTPPADAPEVAPLPAATRGHLTLGCFQNVAKLGTPTFALWEAVLRALPQARLRLQSTYFSAPAARDALRQRLVEHGIAEERFEIHGAALYQDYLRAYGEIDFALDTVPYNGGTTTCEALWMGVPTLTLVGDRLISRQGAALMSAAGLPEWIAADAADFCRRAQAFAGDLPALAALRAALRGRVAESPLMHAARFAANFEAAMWSMWRRWFERRADAPQPATEASPAH